MRSVHRSSGRSPVRFARRASTFGPSSTPSWYAQVTDFQPGRLRVRWEPLRRSTTHPRRSSARSTFRALVDGHRLTALEADRGSLYRIQLSMLDLLCDHPERERLSVRQRGLLALAIDDDTR